MLLVSVILPYYKGREYLIEALDSLLQQSLQNFEVIVVAEPANDAADLFEAYQKKDKRIKVYTNPKRLGISASLNIGLEAAKGKYIARMDGDDICLPDRLKCQVEYLEDHPEVVMCGTKAEEFGTGRTGWKIETERSKLSTDILFYSPCIHSSIMLRRDVLIENNIRYNENFIASEDYEVFSKICKYGDMVNLDKTLIKYRVSANNATNVILVLGIIKYKEVMDRQFKELGIIFSAEEISLLCVHEGLKGKKDKDALIGLIKIDLLLKRIFISNEEKKIYDKQALFLTLHKRFKEAYLSMRWACKKYNKHKAEEIYKKSIFYREEWYTPFEGANDAPMISVVIPTYNSEEYIADTIWSILEQTEQDFEVLVINEYGSKDHTEAWINAFEDSRIKVINNETKLGLADSLNKGITLARGKYIARADADDLYDPERFEKQLNYMENHPECGVCGTWQHHFGLTKDEVHKTPETYEEIKAELLYHCEMCHSTIMLRTQVFREQNLLYDRNYAAEDYELWTRAIWKTEFHNIQEVLGEYRWNDNNITKAKMDILCKESAEIVYKQIMKRFDIDIPQEYMRYFNGWQNEMLNEKSFKDYYHILKKENDLIKKLRQQNRRKKVYDTEVFDEVLAKRWHICTGTYRYYQKLNINRKGKSTGNISFILLYYIFCKMKKVIKIVMD